MNNASEKPFFIKEKRNAICHTYTWCNRWFVSPHSRYCRWQALRGACSEGRGRSPHCCAYWRSKGTAEPSRLVPIFIRSRRVFCPGCLHSLYYYKFITYPLDSDCLYSTSVIVHYKTFGAVKITCAKNAVIF